MDQGPSFRTEANLNNLGAIRRFVEERATDLRVDADAIYDLLLIVTEMATNIIVHGYRGEPGPIEVAIDRDGRALAIRLRDEANPFDPTTIPPPELNLPLEKRPLGGMGVYLTRQLVDQMIHRVTSNGGNELTLIKENIIPTQAEEESDGYDR